MHCFLNIHQLQGYKIRVEKDKVVGAAERLGPFTSEAEWGRGAGEIYAWLSSGIEQRLLKVLRRVFENLLQSFIVIFIASSIQIKLPPIEQV